MTFNVIDAVLLLACCVVSFAIGWQVNTLVRERREDHDEVSGV